MLVDMYELESSLDPSLSHCLDPEGECMIVVVEYGYSSIVMHESDKVFESYTGSECSIFNFFESNILSNLHIIESAMDEARDRECRSASVNSRAFIPGKGVVSEWDIEYLLSIIAHGLRISLLQIFHLAFCESYL